ncbi:MAG: Stk1 family PASTA domain-containing Ser/Thr kinase [Angelakisella sp.]
MDKFLGRTLEGRYLIEELIGVGGMANVYKGYDRMEHRTVAIKMLRDEYSGNDEFLRRFRDESRAIYSLNHPNIVKIYDVILNTQNPAIVMEYVDGITVKDYIDRKGIVGLRIAVSLTMQLLRALQHAHDNGIVHRDIKPQNIMLPGDGSIKVMDFGIARFAMSQSRTITSRAIGSVHYTSPEQARGDSVIDHRSDIYSAGVILYEMLTAQLPFEGENPVAVAMKQIDQLPLAPTVLNPQIPKGLEEIVLRAMEKLPDDRYQSAYDMMQDIERFVENPSIVFGYKQRLPANHPSASHKPYSFEDEEGSNQMDKNRNTSKRTTPTSSPPTRQQVQRKTSFLSVLFGITCAFVVGTLCFVGYMFYQNNPFEEVPEVNMPDLLGKKYDDVRKDKAYKDFNFELVEQEYNDKYAQGEIYEQYPTSGKRVKSGITIKVKVSNGQQSVTLPDFSGQESTLVLAKLREMGLTGDQTLINSDEVPDGNVVRTEPAANQTLNVGSSVTVYVSRGSGKEKVRVPDVTGQDVESAKEILEASGLTVGTIIRQVSDLPPGIVLAQNPNYPAPVAADSKVNLTVSAEFNQVEGSKSASILCMLPIDVEQSVRLTVDQDGLEFLNQMIVPSESRVVNITVPGDEGTTVITVKINNKVYRSYTVDFNGEQATYTDLTDNSEGFTP